MLKAGQQGRLGVREVQIRARQLGEGDPLAGVNEEAADFHRVLKLLAGLDDIPVGKAGEADVLVIVGEFQIQIAGVQLLVDLLIKHFGNFFFNHVWSAP